MSFGHHEEVAGLSETEQEDWLDKAEKHKWSQKRLRKEIREA